MDPNISYEYKGKTRLLEIDIYNEMKAITRRGPRKCSTCNGSGWVDYDEHIPCDSFCNNGIRNGRTCPYCKGRGYNIRKRRGFCQTCNGKGYL